MSDANSQSSGAAGEGSSRSESRGEATSDRTGDSWLDRLRAAVGLKSSAADLRENLEEILDAGDGDTGGGFSAEERAMIRNILKLGETTVDDVMIARAEIDGVAEDIRLDRLMLTFLETGHSRMPVYRESLDDAVGMIHIRDLMGHVARAAAVEPAGAGTAAPAIDLTRVDLSRTLAEAGLVRPVLFVPGSMPATDLLARMRQNRIQMALVIDEYGGVDGLVSLEDIVETVVGDIEDEHDVVEAADIVDHGDGVWLVDARAGIEEVSQAIDLDLAVTGFDEEVETIGGLVVSLTGRVPETGETIVSEHLPGLTIGILEADARRIRRLRLTRTGEPRAAGRATG
jgi:CBS domain containing-hemolysin-like protein